MIGEETLLHDRRKEQRISDAVPAQLLAGADAKAVFNSNGLLGELKKALAERALNAEMDHHLVNGESGNSRNDDGRNLVLTDTGKLALDIPRDRQSTFDPHLIAKYQRRFYAFSDCIRRLVYTTNAIKALNVKLRHVVRAREHLPTDEAALKLLFLVLNRAKRSGPCHRRNGAWLMPNSPSCLATASQGLWPDRVQPPFRTRNSR